MDSFRHNLFDHKNWLKFLSIPLFPCFFNHKEYFKNIKYGYCQFPVIVISPNCSDFKVKIGNFFPLPIAIRGHFEKVTTLFTYCAGSILQGFSLSISHMWILKKKKTQRKKVVVVVPKGKGSCCGKSTIDKLEKKERKIGYGVLHLDLFIDDLSRRVGIFKSFHLTSQWGYNWNLK